MGAVGAEGAERAKTALLSILFCAAALFLFLGVPCLLNLARMENLLRGEGALDAVSSASLAVPDQPSGEFVVLLNRSRHPDTLAAWENFFREVPEDVIFEDLHCLVVDADTSGAQIAERYRARLAEHQMTIRRENALLAVSRVQAGAFDVFVCSAEVAEVLRLDTVYGREDVFGMVIADNAEASP